jgi:hypothetical protein
MSTSSYPEIDESTPHSEMNTDVNISHIVTHNISNSNGLTTKTQPTKNQTFEFTISKSTWLNRWGPAIGSLTFGILECVNASTNSPPEAAFNNTFYPTLWGTFYGSVVGSIFPMAAPAVICSIPIYWWLKKE